MPLPPEEPQRSANVAVPNLFGDLDDLPQFSEPTPVWHPDVRERLKVLLHAEPLVRLLRADAHLERASDLMLRFDLGLKAGDALHVAIAQNAGATSFVTLDKRLAAAAVQLGLAVEQPA